MSKKHFNRLAAKLAASKPNETTPEAMICPDALPAMLKQWTKDVENVADVCDEFNENFNYPRFVAACNAVS